MVHWLLSTMRCKTFALIGLCLRHGVIILQRAVEILQRVVDWAARLQRPAIHDDNVARGTSSYPRFAERRFWRPGSLGAGWHIVDK